MSDEANLAHGPFFDGLRDKPCDTECHPFNHVLGCDCFDNPQERNPMQARTRTPPPSERAVAMEKAGKELNEGFLRHAVVASSQYDDTCASMAAEILRLRAHVGELQEISGRDTKIRILAEDRIAFYERHTDKQANELVTVTVALNALVREMRQDAERASGMSQESKVAFAGIVVSGWADRIEKALAK